MPNTELCKININIYTEIQNIQRICLYQKSLIPIGKNSVSRFGGRELSKNPQKY